MKKIIIVILIGLLIGFGLFVWIIRMMADKPRDYGKTESIAHSELQNGDIIFQTSKSSQSQAIQLATNSKYSHMGIIYEINGRYFVYEAVGPVQLTQLNDWIKRGENSHYVVRRLTNSDKILTEKNLTRLKDVGEKFRGKSYDIYFEWTDDYIYCSELVWKMYKEALGIEIGELQELLEFDLTSEVVKSKLKERYGDKIPLHEKVISPAAIFESDKLLMIQQN